MGIWRYQVSGERLTTLILNVCIRVNDSCYLDEIYCSWWRPEILRHWFVRRCLNDSAFVIVDR